MDIDTSTVAKIVARIKAASGQEIDEQQLEALLNNSLKQLKEQDPTRYLETIEELSTKLEDMATQISQLQVQS
jgi:chorismate mutase